MLEATVATASLCRYREYSLRLSADIRFANNTIAARDWLLTALKLILLEIDMQRIDFIESDAFAGSAFGSVRTLLLVHFRCLRLEPHQFRGLLQLRMLMFFNLQTDRFIDDYLLDVATTLQELIVTSTDRAPTTSFHLAGLTSWQLATASSVKFMLPLGSAITERTFAGLVAVAYFDLSNCHITAIAAGAFRASERTLLQLKLVNNRLQRLPAGLFDVVALRPNIEVRLAQNQWRCECGHALDTLREYLRQWPTQFADEAVCASPPALRGRSVAFVEQECVSQPASPATNQSFWLRCRHDGHFELDEMVALHSMTRRKLIVWLSWHTNGSLVVQFQHNEDPEHVAVFSKTASKISLVCLSDRQRDQLTVSPFECVTFNWPVYAGQRGLRIWLTAGLKEPVVMSVAGAMVALWFVGIALGLAMRAVCYADRRRRSVGAVSVSSAASTELSSVEHSTNNIVCGDYEYGDYTARYATSTYAASSYAAYRYLVILSDYCRLDRLPECQAPAAPPYAHGRRSNSLQ